MSGVHPTAIVDPAAELGSDVEVGPHAVIGPRVEVGARCEIGAGAQLRGPARLGVENRVFAHACLGFEPQDLKYGGEETWLEVGDRNHFREFVTVHRGTGKGGGWTRIGSGGLFMAYSHVAHDCTVGDRVIFANAATLAGHVVVGDDATIGAFSAVHQHCRVGRHAYIGGFSVITQDALPFVKTVGHKPACYGLNRIGLERKGFGPETLRRLEAALRLLTRRGPAASGSLAALRAASAQWEGDPHVAELIDFVAGSQRGVIRGLPGHGRSRGAVADAS